MQQHYDYLYKIILVGNLKVGKSSMLLRFADNIFNESFLPSIGVDFKIRMIDVNGKTAKLQIWDTAGQERFKTIIGAFYKGAHGIILVYDVTDKQSFKDLEQWIADVKKYGDENAVKLLVGNKIDLEDKREVTYEEGKELADSLNIGFIETSAKTSTNVQEVFISLAQMNQVKEK